MHDVEPSSRAGSSRPRLVLQLLPDFELRREGVPLVLPQSATRLVALLAVLNRPVERAYVGCSLWPEATEGHSAGSLRSALWRSQCADARLVESCGTRLRLASVVEIDLRRGSDWADDVLRLPPQADVAVTAPWLAVLARDLLTDWYDDWVVLPRERWRQLRLHALEQLAVRWARRGEFSAAVGAALTAVEGDPLRESAHRVLVEVHLMEGNRAEAVRAYQRFRGAVESELGVPPSPRLTNLLTRARVAPSGASSHGDGEGRPVTGR